MDDTRFHNHIGGVAMGGILRFLGSAIGIIFLIGLLVLIGLLMLIF